MIVNPTSAVSTDGWADSGCFNTNNPPSINPQNGSYGTIGSGYCVAWSPRLGLLVAAGFPFGFGGYPDGTFLMMTSPDGVHWTRATTPWDGAQGGNVYQIAWADAIGMFVATGFGNLTHPSDSLLTSTDGVNWIGQSPLSATVTVDVGWNGSELLIRTAQSEVYASVPPGAPGLLSFDGSSWIADYEPGLTLFPENTRSPGSSICWIPEWALWIVTGDGVNGIMSSPDAVDWSHRTLAFPSSSAPVGPVCYAPSLGRFGTAIAFVGFTGPAQAYVAVAAVPDVWVQHPLSGTINGLAVVTSVCWSEELGIFVATGARNRIWTSGDGINWTERANPFIPGSAAFPLSQVIWAKELGLFVAVGQAFTSNANNVMTSPDGVSWTAQNTPLDDITLGFSDYLLTSAWCPYGGPFVIPSVFGPDPTPDPTSGF